MQINFSYPALTVERKKNACNERRVNTAWDCCGTSLRMLGTARCSGGKKREGAGGTTGGSGCPGCPTGEGRSVMAPGAPAGLAAGSCSPWGERCPARGGVGAARRGRAPWELHFLRAALSAHLVCAQPELPLINRALLPRAGFDAGLPKRARRTQEMSLAWEERLGSPAAGLRSAYLDVALPGARSFSSLHPALMV